MFHVASVTLLLYEQTFKSFVICRIGTVVEGRTVAVTQPGNLTFASVEIHRWDDVRQLTSDSRRADEVCFVASATTQACLTFADIVMLFFSFVNDFEVTLMFFRHTFEI